MAEAQITPLDNEDQSYRYTRRAWRDVGTDNFTQAPGDNEDMCQELLNILPPMTNVIQRRFGYATFIPTLDTGIASGSDQLPLSALHGTGFDGETGYVYTTKTITWANNPTQSIELWFETDSISGGYLVSVNASAQIVPSETQRFGIYMNTTGHIGVGLFDGAVVTLSALTPLAYNDSNGHMLVVTISGGVVLIYVDGVLVLTTSVTTAGGTVPAFWRLAQGPNTAGWVPTIDEFFQGFLSHVSIFPIVLTQAQVTAHFAALTVLGGTQSLYETAVQNSAPSYFWFLDETTTAVPPSKAVIVQTAKTSFAGTTGTLTFPLPVTVGHILVLGVAGTGSVTTAIVDNQANSYSETVSLIGAGGTGFNLANWTATIGATGTLTITFTNTPGGSGAETQWVIAHELQNASLPVDGSGIISTTSPTFNSPTITTADEPDLILAFAFTDAPTVQPVTGNGFSTAASLQVKSSFDGLNHILLDAFSQTTALGNFSCSFVQSHSSRMILSTLGIPLSIPATTPGNNAFDSADSNNGFYAVVSNPNSISNNTYTQVGAVVTYTATASGENILVGDTAILMNTINGTTPSIVSITDTSGNVWSSQSPNGLDFASGADLFQIWTASQTKAINIGSTLVLTITLNSSASTPTQISFANYPQLGVVQTSAHATVTTGTALSSGGVTVSIVPAVLIAFGATASTFSVTPTAPFGTVFMGTSAHNGTTAAAVEAFVSTVGTYTDSWTFAGSSSGAAVLLAFNASGGFFLGQFIVVA